jgi:hypothetical protein
MVNVSDDDRERGYLTETGYMHFETDYKLLVVNWFAALCSAISTALHAVDLLSLRSM